MVTIRRVTRKDFEQLPVLYRQILHKEVSPEEIKWRFTQNPLLKGELWNYAAVNEREELVAHSAFIPMEYHFNGKIFSGALSAGSMVLQKYGGLFAGLYKELEKEARKNKVDFLFAFPNLQSFPFFVKLFGYEKKYFAYLSAGAKTITNLSVSKNVFYRGGVIRNSFGADFIKWRITAHPLFKYQIYPDFICKWFAGNELDIVALIPESVKNIKKKPKVHFGANKIGEPIKQTENIKKIQLYSTEKSLTLELKRMGFAEQSVPNKFVVKILNHELKNKPFFLQMIDSDVF